MRPFSSSSATLGARNVGGKSKQTANTCAQCEIYRAKWQEAENRCRELEAIIVLKDKSAGANEKNDYSTMSALTIDQNTSAEVFSDASTTNQHPGEGICSDTIEILSDDENASNITDDGIRDLFSFLK